MIQTWRIEHGLPSNTIHDVIQTQDGFVWIATARGLARFDGINITVYEGTPGANARNADCRKLAQDHRGDLWVGTSQGLFRISGSSCRRFGVAEGLPADEINEILAVPPDELWVGTPRGLACVHNATVRTIDTGPGLWNEIRDIHLGHGQIVMIATPMGILYFDRKTESFSSEKNTPFRGVGGLMMDESLRFAAGGEFLWQKTDKGWIQRSDLSTSLDRSISFSRDHAGALWFWDLEKGLIRMNSAGSVVSYTVPGVDVTECRITCFFADRERGHWIGTSAGGIQRWQPRPVRPYVQTATAPDAHSLLESHDGSVWVGTENGLLRIRQQETSVWTEKDGLAHNSVRALAEDAQGRIWIGTVRALHFLENGTLGTITFPGEWAANKIRALLAARDSTLWVGSVVGLHRVRNGIVTQGFDSACPLSHVEIRELHQAQDGRIWIGTAAHGLYRWDEKDLARYAIEDGLSNHSIWSICESTDGALWFGTERGLTRFFDGKFSKIFMERGLPDDQFSQLLSQGAQIWLGTRMGLFSAATRDLHAAADGSLTTINGMRLDENDGIPPSSLAGELSQNPCLRLRSGELLFCATNGVLTLAEDDHRAPSDVPTAIELLRAGVTILHEAAIAPRSNPTGAASISISPAQRSLVQFTYGAPCFTSPKKVQFKYRLQPLEKNWTEAGTRRDAFYTHLPPGEYRFEVVASVKAGVWGEKPAVLAFAVGRKIHETGAFRGGAAAAMAALGFVVIFWRRRSVQRLQQLRQENALAQERQRLARDLHDDLGADLQQLSLRCHLAAQNATKPTAVQTDVAEIGIAARSALTRLIRIIHIIEPQSTTTADLVQVISDLAGSTLGLANVRWKVRTIEPFPTRSLRPQVRHELIVASREALRNILQHSHADSVEITFSQRDGRIMIEVEDNGHADTCLTGPKHDCTSLNSGRGLQNLRSRMERLNGEFTFRTTDAGSIAMFSVPVPEDPA